MLEPLSGRQHHVLSRFENVQFALQIGSSLCLKNHKLWLVGMFSFLSLHYEVSEAWLEDQSRICTPLLKIHAFMRVFPVISFCKRSNLPTASAFLLSSRSQPVIKELLRIHIFSGREITLKFSFLLYAPFHFFYGGKIIHFKKVSWRITTFTSHNSQVKEGLLSNLLSIAFQLFNSTCPTALPKETIPSSFQSIFHKLVCFKCTGHCNPGQFKDTKLAKVAFAADNRENMHIELQFTHDLRQSMQ